MKASIEQLQAFFAVAEMGHITRAADRLGISQSTLSATIQKLEALLGVKLFDRNTRGCFLSEAGTALQPSLARLAQDWTRVVAEAKDFTSIGHGRLAIAAPSAQRHSSLVCGDSAIAGDGFKGRARWVKANRPTVADDARRGERLDVDRIALVPA